MLRCLSGFGPASVADVAQFAMVTRARTRAALAGLAGELDRLAWQEGEELSDLPGAPRPEGAEPAPPRLMAMWDSVLPAYADRGRVLPEAYRRTVIRANGDVLPTLPVDGYVAGVWRPAAGGHRGDRVPPSVRRGLGGARRRGPVAGGVPRRAGTAGLPTVRALVGTAPGRHGAGAARRLIPQPAN